MAALIAACQTAEGDPPTMTADELLGDWTGFDLAEEAVVVEDAAGRIVACADIFNRRYVQGSVFGRVHPDHLGRGLGAALVRWGEEWLQSRMDRAPDGARVVVQHHIRATNDRARGLLATHGYAQVRTNFVMAITLDAPPPDPAWPAGIAGRDFVPGQDERATFDALEESFADMWERTPGEYDRWLGMTELERREPDLWSLAVDEASGEIAGICLGHLPGASGWIGSVGVRRPWRGRGVALALLHRGFAAFYRRGVREIGLSVDAESPTGALRLYRRAGMRVTQEFLLHRKELRAGRG